MKYSERSSIPRGPRWRSVRLIGCVSAALLGAATPAHAQLRLPSLPLPALPGQPPASAREALPVVMSLQEQRLSAIRDLLRRHPEAVEVDLSGEPVRRHEVLLISPSPSILAAALAQGFAVLRDEVLAELELRQMVLRPPVGMSTSEAVARLRAIDPEAQADFNHIYLPSGETGAAPAAAPTLGNKAPRRVGLIDGGVDWRHRSLQSAQLRSWGCDGRALPSTHGTAVASLLVGRDAPFAGVLPEAMLYSADVYCEQPGGGAAEDVARALAWISREHVAVVNISLVGPPNKLLEQSVGALIRKGHLVVAAVGNDGPAAPPLYPASYAGVIGVTGVNAARHVLPEAAQGPQVMLAAPGADLAVARLGGGYFAARGTSYAAPVVAGLLAEQLQEPSLEAATMALSRLIESAEHLGAPGRDPAYGLGLVGERTRVAPELVHAQPRRE